MTKHPRWRRSPAAGPAARGGRLLPFLILAALASGGGVAKAGGGLAVSHPWIRSILPSRPAAGYFILSNSGDAPRLLVGAESPACGSMMLHHTVSEGGVERMLPVKRLRVPARGTIRFAPGGYHLMCMAPSKAVRRGNTVPVTLRFDDGAHLTARFPVRGATGR